MGFQPRGQMAHFSGEEASAQPRAARQGGSRPLPAMQCSCLTTAHSSSGVQAHPPGSVSSRASFLALTVKLDFQRGTRSHGMKFSDTKVTCEKSVFSLPGPSHLEP